MNAIVYGWTREEFLYVMAVTSKNGSQLQSYSEDFDGSTEETEAELSMSTKGRYSVVHSMVIHTDSD